MVMNAVELCVSDLLSVISLDCSVVEGTKGGILTTNVLEVVAPKDNHEGIHDHQWLEESKGRVYVFVVGSNVEVLGGGLSVASGIPDP